MYPSSVDIRLRHARAVAANLREAAGLCDSYQFAVKARLLQAAQTIDEVVTMVEAQTFVARLNHETIVEMTR